MASGADRDYNMQFDPKNLVLSSHTSPEKDKIHTEVNTVYEKLHFTERNAANVDACNSYLVCDNLYVLSSCVMWI